MRLWLQWPEIILEISQKVHYQLEINGSWRPKTKPMKIPVSEGGKNFN